MATFKKGVVQVVDRYDINMDLEVLKFDVPARTIPTGQAHAHVLQPYLGHDIGYIQLS